MQKDTREEEISRQKAATPSDMSRNIRRMIFDELPI